MKAQFYYDGDRETYVLDNGKRIKDLGNHEASIVDILLQEGPIHVEIDDDLYEGIDDVEEDEYEISLPDLNNPGHFIPSNPMNYKEAIEEAQKIWGADDEGNICIVNGPI